MPVSIDLGKCIGSGECVKACAFNAIEVRDGKAVVFENCVDCDACVRACPTAAIASATAPSTSASGVAIVDFGERSAIVSVIERAAKRAGSSTSALRVDPSDAGAAADALATEIEKNSTGLVALPHDGAGPAIAARLAAKTGATLLAGCSDLQLEDSGGLRAVRLRYGGIVKTTSRVGPGRAIVTLVPRRNAPFAAQSLDMKAAGEIVGAAPAAPIGSANCVVAVAADNTPETLVAARECAKTLGAIVIDPATLSGQNVAPELYIAFGVDGSTEHNAAVRGAGTIVALVGADNAAIAQIADYLLVGDVTAHAQALLAAL